jgi:uncharacterized protein YacL
VSRGGPTAILVRAAVTASLAALGALAAARLLARGILVGPNNLLYLSVLGALVGWLASGPLAAWSERRVGALARRLGRIEPEAVLAAGTGATVALVITVLLNTVLASVPGFTWYWSLLIAALLVASSAAFFVANRHLLPFGRAGEEAGSAGAGRPKVVDTSAIIDGRLVDVAEASFLDGRVLLPAFVLGELQSIADDADPLRRKRGRRGLEVLERLAALHDVETEVVHDDVAEAKAVDDKLVLLARRRRADLITTDYNLHQVAQLQDVRVLNLHQLANAMKAAYLPGDTLSLSVVRTGREPGQGLAYLEDGTMVVIEDAADRVGASVDAVVTSSLQTNMGRMIFARLVPDEDASDGA